MRMIDADQLLDFIKFYGRVVAPEDHIVRDIVMLIQTAPTIAQPPNDPLTPEQLREMDGEPVWNDTVKKYALVDAGWWNGIGRAINSNGKYRLLDDRYYRRKPEAAND